MSEPGKPDRWNSLLETLGVPVSESRPTEPAAEAKGEEASMSAAPKSQPISMLRPEKPKPAAKPKAAPPPAKSPSYWSRIAGALGLEVAAAPEPPRAAESREEASEEAAPPREELGQPAWRAPEAPPSRPADLPPRAFERPARRERTSREEHSNREQRPRYEERPRSEDQPRRGEESPRSALDEMFGKKSDDIDVFGLGAGNESPRMREPRDRAEEESGSVLEYDRPEDSGSDLPLGFGTPQQDAGDEGPDRGGRRRRRRRGRGRRGGREGRESPAPRHEADIEPAGEETDFDDRDVELDLDRDLSGERDTSRPPRPDHLEEAGRFTPGGSRAGRENDRDDERGGRPRRRRRRGGGRERDEATSERPEPFQLEEGEPARFGPPHDERRQPPRAARPADDEPDDELLDVGEEPDEGQGGDVPTHKKIPTWEEAVGLLIDANMANRGPERDRDRGRGRGRGRR